MSVSAKAVGANFVNLKCFCNRLRYSIMMYISVAGFAQPSAQTSGFGAFRWFS